MPYLCRTQISRVATSCQFLTVCLACSKKQQADGQSVQEVLGDDIKGFCSALVSEEGAKSFRDKWRKQLNNNIAKKLGR